LISECGNGNHHGRARLVIQNIGSDTMVNLAQAWAEEYAAVEPVVSVEVSGGGAGTGVAALINGTADIANCSRQSNSGTYHYFREAILGKGVDFKLGTLDLHGSKDVVELVSRTPCAIGYSGMGYATPYVKMLRVALKPGETAFAPNVENTQTAKYPIARPLYMYTRGEPKGSVKKYLKWVQSEAGQAIVRATGYVPIVKEPGLRAAAEQGAKRP
jgi:ABC-type phosphate transport system substrate-binding protein